MGLFHDGTAILPPRSGRLMTDCRFCAELTPISAVSSSRHAARELIYCHAYARYA